MSNLTRLIILLRCFLFWPARGRAVEKVQNPHSVVIIQLSKLGDTVCITPVFRAIKKNYPGCRVTVVGSKLNKQVLEYNPDVDDYVVWAKELPRLISLFQRGGYDFGCLLGPDSLTLAAMYLGGVKTICVPTYTNGWTPYETISYRLLSWLAVKKEQQIGAYAPKEYLKLLEPLAIQESETKKYLYFSKAADRKAGALLSGMKNNSSGHFLVGIIAGAGNKIKQWPPQKFAQVADYLIERYNARVIVIGGENNEKESWEMLSAMNYREAVLDTTGVLSLDELKALISQLQLFISVDTGPIYFAEALGVPTIDITGPIDEREQPPIGDFHVVVVPMERNGPAVTGMTAHHYDEVEALRQTGSISVEMVKSAADKLIAKIKK